MLRVPTDLVTSMDIGPEAALSLLARIAVTN